MRNRSIYERNTRKFVSIQANCQSKNRANDISLAFKHLSLQGTSPTETKLDKLEYNTSRLGWKTQFILFYLVIFPRYILKYFVASMLHYIGSKISFILLLQKPTHLWCRIPTNFLCQALKPLFFLLRELRAV